MFADQKMFELHVEFQSPPGFKAPPVSKPQGKSHVEFQSPWGFETVITVCTQHGPFRFKYAFIPVDFVVVHIAYYARRADNNAPTH